MDNPNKYHIQSLISKLQYFIQNHYLSNFSQKYDFKQLKFFIQINTQKLTNIKNQKSTI
jgi:hypothetical protein